MEPWDVLMVFPKKPKKFVEFKRSSGKKAVFRVLWYVRSEDGWVTGLKRYTPNKERK
jgi:hypothetical protein